LVKHLYFGNVIIISLVNSYYYQIHTIKWQSM